MSDVLSGKAYLLDASAVLALVHQEPGQEVVKPILDEAVISSVNWSEVLQKLDRAGLDTQKIAGLLQSLGLHVVPFTESQAQRAATLWQQAKPLGLSLADRACLACGEDLALTIMTADKVWKNVDLTVDVRVIR